MILGDSRFVHRCRSTQKFVSAGLVHLHETTKIHVDVNIVNGYELDIEAFKMWRTDFANAEFLIENGKFLCTSEVEKMSKSKYNVVSPDKICDDYGADTLRLYEMFLGPLQDAKPWDLKGIEGVKRFLNKLWRLFYDENDQPNIDNTPPTAPELKTLHTLIKKISEDIENLSYNTSVSAFMICTNELTDLKCRKKAILEPLILCLAPFAPHIAEEIWHTALHQTDSVAHAAFPVFDATHLVATSVEYPITINGKVKQKITLPAGLSVGELETAVRQNTEVMAALEGKDIKKLIVVPNKIINFVV
jgi:leucyl-tRNA synthetase